MAKQEDGVICTDHHGQGWLSTAIIGGALIVGASIVYAAIRLSSSTIDIRIPKIR